MMDGAKYVGEVNPEEFDQALDNIIDHFSDGKCKFSLIYARKHSNYC